MELNIIFLSKWTLFQALVIVILFSYFYVIETFSSKGTAPPLNDGFTAVNSVYLLLLFISVVIFCFYFLFFFQQKKNRAFLSYPIWSRVPLVTIITGVLSFVVFIFIDLSADIYSLVQSYGFLLYVFLSYFLFLLYIFIFSMLSTFMMKDQTKEKALHLSPFVTVGIFIVLFLVM